MSATGGKRTFGPLWNGQLKVLCFDDEDEAHLAIVSVAGGLSWRSLMDTIGDQLLVGFGSFENLGQLEEALYIALSEMVLQR
jgi:hypothetical protein